MSLESIYQFAEILRNHTEEKNNEKTYLGFENFYNEYIRYADSILKGKIFSERELADYIFENKITSRNKYKEFLRRNLFAAVETLKHFKEKVNVNNIDRYVEVLSILKTDIEELTAKIETNYLELVEKVSLHSWRASNKRVSDIFNVAKSFFFFDDAEQLSDFHSFDIRPYSIFTIRQLIEMYGKEILGLITVEDAHGNFSKKHLYSAWDFIKKETSTNTSRIKLPFDIEIMLKMQTWSHRFVHTTNDSPYFIIFSAISMLRQLFQINKDGIITYDGKRTKKIGFASVELTRYNDLKESFNEYINTNKDGTVGNQFIPVWKEISQVRSYIISL